MFVISPKIIKMINSSTKSYRYEENLWYTGLTATLCRGIIGSRVTKWNVFYTALVSCMMGVIWSLTKIKAFKGLAPTMISEVSFIDLLLPCVVKIIKGLKITLNVFIALLLVIKVTLLKTLLINPVRKDIERS